VTDPKSRITPSPTFTGLRTPLKIRFSSFPRRREPGKTKALDAGFRRHDGLLAASLTIVGLDRQTGHAIT
jgi:hypothetical protein